VDIDAVARDRRAQFELDKAADLDFGVHRRFERPPYPPAVGLRRIKRDIRLREQASGLIPSSGAEALPMLAPTITSLPSITTARLISAMMRLATAGVSDWPGA
jgi:hypothetical protein